MFDMEASPAISSCLKHYYISILMIFLFCSQHNGFELIYSTHSLIRGCKYNMGVCEDKLHSDLIITYCNT